MPGSLESGHAQAFARMCPCPPSGLRGDAASCGSHKDAGYANDAGILPATLGRSGCC